MKFPPMLETEMELRAKSEEFRSDSPVLQRSLLDPIEEQEQE